ncbi:MAG: phosphatase PAP2 family protein [Bacteroidales bacterium]
MLETLNHIDTRLFLFLNGLHSETFDGIMVWVSGKTTWWPFYLLLLGYLVWSRRMQFVPLLIFIALCITLTDQSSVQLFKEVFERLRPCKEPALQGLVHLVDGKCGGLYGFVSSHAANTFGIAMFLLMVVRKKWFIITMLVWGTLVGYSRIYLGVHYPGDVVVGALLGILCGYMIYLLFKWLVPKLPQAWGMHTPEIR